MWPMAAARFLKTRISHEEKQRVQVLASELLMRGWRLLYTACRSCPSIASICSGMSARVSGQAAYSRSMALLIAATAALSASKTSEHFVCRPLWEISYKAVYFFADPRALVAGYFAAFFSSFAWMAVSKSIPRLSHSSMR